MSGSHFYIIMRSTAQEDEYADAIRTVRAVYKDLTARPIDRNCIGRTECCQFKLTGLVPYLTKGEALVAAKAFRATGRKKMPEPTDGSCPMLNPMNSKCMIYDSRPFGCRTHFCEAAGGPYARAEVLDLIRRLEQVDADLGGWGSSSLPAAVREALKETS